MSLTSKDLDQLETFKRCLGLKNNIGWKSSGFSGTKYSHVQFGDAALYRWLVSIGITPHKTKTIGILNIPDDYFLDFLRGEFDGDGSSHAYWDTRWRSSVSIYINFACASKIHLEWLQKTIYRLISASGVIGGKYHGAYCLRFAKQNAHRLYEAMYYSGGIPFLRRKKEKLDRQWEADILAKQHKQPVGFIKGGAVLRIA